MAPDWSAGQKGAKVQIVDVIELKLATGYDKDPKGRLLLQSVSSVAMGRTWSLAKACQLVRNDANPDKWVVLHRHKKAWGLFWAGGGLELCRKKIYGQQGSKRFGAIVPATPEALLTLILATEDPESAPALQRNGQTSRRAHNSFATKDVTPWKAIALTSLVWAIVTVGLGTYGIMQIHQQTKQIQRLVENTRNSDYERKQPSTANKP